MSDDYADSLKYAFGADLAADPPRITATEVLRRIASKVNPPLELSPAMLIPVRLRPGYFTYTSKPEEESPVTVTTKKQIKEKQLPTIGVRFPETPAKIYTYAVPKGSKVHLGQELVADTPRGPAVVYVVRIDKMPQTPEFGHTLKTIERRAVSL